MAKRTYRISNVDGTNPREITLAQFMDLHRKAIAKVSPVVKAFRDGDLKACASAQLNARSV